MKLPTSALALFTSLLLFAACQTAPKIDYPSDRAVIYQGQLRYAGNENPLIGGVIVRLATSNHFQMDFFTGPGFPLMRLSVDGDRGTAEGIIARRHWQGPTEKAPARIAGWFVLPEVFTAAGGESGVLQGEKWTANSIHAAGRLTRLTVWIAGSGETFTFQIGA